MQVTILGKLGLETAQPNEEEKKVQKDKAPKWMEGNGNTPILAVLKSGLGGNTFFHGVLLEFVEVIVARLRGQTQMLFVILGLLRHLWV